MEGTGGGGGGGPVPTPVARQIPTDLVRPGVWKMRREYVTMQGFVQVCIPFIRRTIEIRGGLSEGLKEYKDDPKQLSLHQCCGKIPIKNFDRLDSAGADEICDIEFGRCRNEAIWGTKNDLEVDTEGDESTAGMFCGGHHELNVRTVIEYSNWCHPEGKTFDEGQIYGKHVREDSSAFRLSRELARIKNCLFRRYINKFLIYSEIDRCKYGPNHTYYFLLLQNYAGLYSARIRRKVTELGESIEVSGKEEEEVKMPTLGDMRRQFEKVSLRGIKKPEPVKPKKQPQQQPKKKKKKKKGKSSASSSESEKEEEEGEEKGEDILLLEEVIRELEEERKLAAAKEEPHVWSYITGQKDKEPMVQPKDMVAHVLKSSPDFKKWYDAFRRHLKYFGFYALGDLASMAQFDSHLIPIKLKWKDPISGDLETFDQVIPDYYAKGTGLIKNEELEAKKLERFGRELQEPGKSPEVGAYVEFFFVLRHIIDLYEEFLYEEKDVRFHNLDNPFTLVKSIREIETHKPNLGDISPLDRMEKRLHAKLWALWNTNPILILAKRAITLWTDIEEVRHKVVNQRDRLFLLADDLLAIQREYLSHKDRSDKKAQESAGVFGIFAETIGALQEKGSETAAQIISLHFMNRRFLGFEMECLARIYSFIKCIAEMESAIIPLFLDVEDFYAVILEYMHWIRVAAMKGRGKAKVRALKEEMGLKTRMEPVSDPILRKELEDVLDDQEGLAFYFGTIYRSKDPLFYEETEDGQKVPAWRFSSTPIALERKDSWTETKKAPPVVFPERISVFYQLDSLLGACREFIVKAAGVAEKHGRLKDAPPGTKLATPFEKFAYLMETLGVHPVNPLREKTSLAKDIRDKKKPSEAEEASFRREFLSRDPAALRAAIFEIKEVMVGLLDRDEVASKAPSGVNKEDLMMAVLEPRYRLSERAEEFLFMIYDQAEAGLKSIREREQGLEK